MIFGFSGSRGGMRGAQMERVFHIVCGARDWPMAAEVHHGDCVGADKEFHCIVTGLRATHEVTRVVHPPIVAALRAYCVGEVLRPAKDFIARNHDIVNEVQVLIATPEAATPRARSGTWSTIRYAEKVGREVVIVMPDGRLEVRKPEVL